MRRVGLCQQISLPLHAKTIFYCTENKNIKYFLPQQAISYVEQGFVPRKNFIFL